MQFYFETASFSSKVFRIMKTCLRFTLFLMIKQISITLILSLLMFVQAFSQDKLASLPEQQRDSVLVEIAQNLLKEKYPKWYRENVNPEVTKGKFVDMEWTKRFYNVPDDVKEGDIYYRIKLHYPDYSKEKFEFAHTADVLVIGKTLQPFYIHLGAVNIGHRLLYKSNDK